MEPAGTSEAESADPGVPRRLWRGTALQVVGRVYGSLATFAGLAILARVLSEGDFGRFTFYLAVFALLDAAVDMGTGTVALRRVAANRWETVGLLAAARRVRVALALLGLLAVGSSAYLLDEPGWGWIALAAAYPLTHAFEVSATVFKDRLTWGVPVAIRAVAASLRLAAICLLALGEVKAPAAYLAATAAGSALANLLLHLAARPHLPRPTIPVRAASGLLSEAWPLGLALICQQLYFYVDNLFVRAIEGEVALGHYNAAVRTLSAGIMVAQYAAATGLPWLVRRSGAGGLGEAVARLAQPMCLAAAMVAGLVGPFGERFLELVFGPDFGAASTALDWLLGAAVAIHAGAVALTAVVSLGRPRAVLSITLAALAINIVGNSLLVPSYGIDGAAQATFATELAVVVGALLVLGWSGSSPLRHRPWLWAAAPALYFGARLLSSSLVSAQ
jgi:O-antigen/teichoic acid export membrane protein